MIICKPSLGLREVPQKIWVRSIQLIWSLLDTNKQTNKQTDNYYNLSCHQKPVFSPPVCLQWWARWCRGVGFWWLPVLSYSEYCWTGSSPRTGTTRQACTWYTVQHGTIWHFGKFGPFKLLHSVHYTVWTFFN